MYLLTLRGAVLDFENHVVGVVLSNQVVNLVPIDFGDTGAALEVR